MKLGQIAVAVKDVERATAFYRDILELPYLFGFPGMAFFDAGGGVRLYLTPPEGVPPATSVLYFRVEDIAARHETLRARGVRIVSEPHRVHAGERHELWLAFFQDSEDNTLALMEERPL